MANQTLPTTSAVSRREFARQLGIGISTVKPLLAKGEIRSFQVGRRRLIPVAEIAAFIERRLADTGGDA
jgi:excisionase family DNA binding protein